MCCESGAVGLLLPGDVLQIGWELNAAPAASESSCVMAVTGAVSAAMCRRDPTQPAMTRADPP
jgi:hypothetical protein